MLRASHNLERQARIPVVIERDKAKQSQALLASSRTSSPANANGLGFDFHNRLPDTSKSRIMTGEQLTSWYEKVLDSVKARYRKLRRFSR